MKKSQNNYTKTYYIYILTNDCNSKCYVGQTSVPDFRFQKCQYRGKKIKDAIEQIGWDKFHANLITTTTDKLEANRLEYENIVKYDTVNNGYNSTYGTNYVGNKKRSKKTCAQQSATMSTSRWYYNPTTEETIRIVKGKLVPNGFILGRGGKLKSVRGHSLWMKVTNEKQVAEIA